MTFRFADVTLDQQFIHVDAMRAGNTPFDGRFSQFFDSSSSC
jgi:acyl dehydratase